MAGWSLRGRRPRWRWADRPVDEAQEHFVLSYGSASVPAELVAVARVGPAIKRTFAVEWLFDRSDPARQEVVSAVAKDLDFYLVELGEADPWAYAGYHCGTQADLYSDVHWSFHCGMKKKRPKGT